MVEKKIELRKVPCGECFTAFGEEFVVLDHIDGGVLSIRKDVWKDAPFDTKSKNNLSEASILKVLCDYMKLLQDGGAADNDFIPIRIDLKATDGTRAYGYHEDDIGLLTLEQYGKYKDIIPFADNWWWLATPWATPWLRSPGTYGSTIAWIVNTDGTPSYIGCTNVWGVRPVLNFASSLLVALDNDASEEGNYGKVQAWEDYREYLHDWLEENDSADRSYGISPLGFYKWLEEIHKSDDDEE